MDYDDFGPGSFPGTSAPLDGDLVSVNIHADPARRSKPFSIAKIRSAVLNFSGSRFIGFLTITEDPSVAQLPVAGDWGFIQDSSKPALYLCFNLAGTIMQVELA